MYCVVKIIMLLMVVHFSVGLNDEMRSVDDGNGTVKMWNEKKDVSGAAGYELDLHTGRKKQEQDIMSRILPLMLIPFMISTAIIPMMLVSLKFMLLKSAFIGKLAVIMLIINMFRRQRQGGGVFSHNVQLNEMSMAHYGYSGDEEYGAYINRKRRHLR